MAREPKNKPKRGEDAAKSPADDPAVPQSDAGTEGPESSPAPVEDTELLEMLEHLSKTIDTAHSVLDEQHRMVMEATQPPMPHLPGIEPAQPIAEPPRSRSGPAIAIFTAVASAVFAVGALGAWWLFLNQPETTARFLGGKDESRIANSDATGALPLNPEPPLPKKKPGRQIVAEVTAVPVQQRDEAVRPAGPVNLTNVIDRAPLPPTDIRRAAPQETATVPNQTAARPQSAPQPQVREQAPSPAPRPAPQTTPAPPQVQIPVQRAAPQPPARVQNQPTVSPSAQPPQTASGPAKPAQIARVDPQRPTTSNKLAPKKKAPAPLSSAQEKSILDRGAEMSKLGDIAGARLVLEYAALRGSGQAMFALAQTYDPQFLSARGVIGVAPNVSVALKWYRQASKLGNSGADARARALETQTGQQR